MTGYVSVELANTFDTFTSLLHPDEREEVLKQLYDHIHGKMSNYQAMIRLRTKDRKWKWALTCINKLHSTLDDLNEILSSRVHKIATREEIFFEAQLNSILQSISEVIKENEAVITYDFSRAEKIYYPKKIIDSILVSLLVNAIKYRRYPVTPQIHLATETDDGFLILTVKDNGTGIDMEKLGNKIFGLYQRFHVGKEGKGLGLYIIKNQVELLGGKIAVESIVNKGTMFHVFLKKNNTSYDA